MDNIQALLDAKAKLDLDMEALMAGFTAQDVPLDTRWAAYVACVNANVLSKNDGYGDGFIGTLGSNLTLYDDFGIEKHETSSFPDMYERIMEADGDYQKPLVAAREANLAAWQEAVLASGYSSFTYDW